MQTASNVFTLNAHWFCSKSPFFLYTELLLFSQSLNTVNQDFRCVLGICSGDMTPVVRYQRLSNFVGVFLKPLRAKIPFFLLTTVPIQFTCIDKRKRNKWSRKPINNWSGYNKHMPNVIQKRNTLHNTVSGILQFILRRENQQKVQTEKWSFPEIPDKYFQWRIIGYLNYYCALDWQTKNRREWLWFEPLWSKLCGD